MFLSTFVFLLTISLFSRSELFEEPQLDYARLCCPLCSFVLRDAIETQPETPSDNSEGEDENDEQLICSHTFCESIFRFLLFVSEFSECYSVSSAFCLLPDCFIRLPDLAICPIPSCRSQLNRQQPYCIRISLRREINNLHIKCINMLKPKLSVSCDWKGTLAQLKAHLAQQCPLAETECTAGCGARVIRCPILQHEKSCPVIRAHIEAELAGTTQ